MTSSVSSESLFNIIGIRNFTDRADDVMIAFSFMRFSISCCVVPDLFVVSVKPGVE